MASEKYLVTTIGEEPTAKARNIFRIMRPPQSQCNINDNPDDPVLHVGQPFLIACNESLLVKPGSNILSPNLYLASTKKNERTATKRTNRQMVYMSPIPDGDAVWTAIIPSKGRANAAERFLAMGLPLSVDVSFQITHRQTNQYLTCDKHIATTTEFGVEFECYCDRSTASGKLGLIVSEFKGLSTSQTLSKPDATSFSWHFVVAKDERAGLDSRRLPKSATPEAILAETRDLIASRGVDAFWNLREHFRKLEAHLHSVGKIDREDLKAALLDWGLELNPKYLDTVLNLVDSSNLGLVNLKDFFEVLRGPMSPTRVKVVREVFNRLDRHKDDHVDIDDIALYFNSEDHPLRTIGSYTEQETLNHILKYFEVKGRTHKKIHFALFLEYYADFSATIGDDGYFESVVKSNWSTVSKK